MHITPDLAARHALAPAGITAETAARARVLLSSLPRRDQRLRGEEYVHGLLTAQGRKSMRNIALTVGGPGSEQRLHHFISESTWDWRQVRAMLARHLEATLRPRAWAVLPMDIVKEGERTVGVRRRFVRSLGRYANSQLAYGLWLDGDEQSGPSCPAHWRLALCDDERDAAATLRPAGRAVCADGSAPRDQALEAVLDVSRWGLPSRPVVMIPDPAGLSARVAELRAREQPFMLRISDDTRLLPLPSLAGTAQPWSARSLAETASRHRRRTRWVDPGDVFSPSVAALATRVLLPELAGDRPLLLIAEWRQDARRPSAYWLSDLVDAPLTALLPLSRALRRAADSFARVGVHAGLGDFTGRSLGGWHRHVSLASMAHALAALGPPMGRTDAGSSTAA